MFIENVVRVAEQLLLHFNDIKNYFIQLFSCYGDGDLCRVRTFYGPDEKTPHEASLHHLLAKWTAPHAGRLY